MIHYGKRVWFLSIFLAGLAGFVDGVGYLKLGGFFVSFMTGNSTRLGVGFAISVPDAALAGAMIALFVFGVMLGTIVGTMTRSNRVSLVIVTLLLAMAGLFDLCGHGNTAVALMVLAMGAENTVFQRRGEVSIGLTYMTGTLVKVGQRLGIMLMGGPRGSWLPYALLWLGLVLGAALGAACYTRFGMQSLWIATAASAVATVWAWNVDLGDQAA
jgi:uncharacterized membrane protein YoaK (UPF0700 family)